MNRTKRGRRALLALLAMSTLATWAYVQTDAVSLRRTFEAHAAEKQAEVLARFSRQSGLQTEVRSQAWRRLPVFGTPHAAAMVDVALSTNGGSELQQTLAYYYVWQESNWVEMNSACAQEGLICSH